MFNLINLCGNCKLPNHPEDQHCKRCNTQLYKLGWNGPELVEHTEQIYECLTCGDYDTYISHGIATDYKIVCRNCGKQLYVVSE